MNRAVTSALLFALLICSDFPASGQAVDIGQLLSGKTVPLTLTLKDLGPDWRMFGVKSEGGDYTKLMATMMGGSTSDLFTRGATISAGNDVYLIAYKPRSKPIDYSKIMSSGGMPSATPLSATTVLELSLLNLHTVGGLEDIRPFDLKAELAASAQASTTINNIYSRAKTAVKTVDAGAGSTSTSTSESRLKQMALCAIMYVQDNNERFPADLGNPSAIKKALSPYSKAQSLPNSVFVQVETGKPFRANPWLSRKADASVDNPAQMILFYEPTPDSSGRRYVAYADGHVKQITASQWTTQKTASHIP